MVVSGQPKTQNPNEKKGVQKWIKNYIKKLLDLQRPLGKYVAIDNRTIIWSPFDNFDMATKNEFDISTTTKIIIGCLVVTKFIHCCQVATEFDHN